MAASEGELDRGTRSGIVFIHAEFDDRKPGRKFYLTGCRLRRAKAAPGSAQTAIIAIRFGRGQFTENLQGFAMFYGETN